MKYTVRYAHLNAEPTWKRGETILRGQTVGIMGTSGQSTATHLHIDCAQGEQTRLYQLADYDGAINPAARQLLLFIDRELFGASPVITTQYADIEYFTERGKVHHGFDVVPDDRKISRAHYSIKWNRSIPGKVSMVGYDAKGYGHFIYITFEV